MCTLGFARLRGNSVGGVSLLSQDTGKNSQNVFMTKCSTSIISNVYGTHLWTYNWLKLQAYFQQDTIFR